MKRMVTYVICVDGSPLLKIGRTQDIKARMRSFEVGIPYGVGLLYLFDGNIEKLLHKNFKEKRIKGEWFDVPHWEIQSFAVGTLGAKELSINTLYSKRKHREIVSKYPFSALAIGESFDIPVGCNVSTMVATTYQKSARMGKKFRVNKEKNIVERIE